MAQEAALAPAAVRARELAMVKATARVTVKALVLAEALESNPLAIQMVRSQ